MANLWVHWKTVTRGIIRHLGSDHMSHTPRDGRDSTGHALEIRETSGSFRSPFKQKPIAAVIFRDDVNYSTVCPILAV